MRITHFPLALMLALSLVLPGLANEPAASLADLKPRVSSLVEPLIEGEAVVGLAVGLIRDKETSVYGFGKAAPDKDAPPDGDTLFEIGSISKVFTGLLLADMAERKLVTLDEPVAKLLPETATVPDREGRLITLAQLASHTSGLPRMPDNMKPADAANPYADYTVDQMYAFLAGCKLARNPGEQMEYSNLGAGLLGHALALRAGKSYEELLLERICTPLQMTSTRIKLTDSDRARLARGHDADGNAAANWDLPTLDGAGGIRSSVNDMLRFLSANLGEVETPLDAAIKASHVSRHESTAPPVSVALGWHVTGRLIWHNGQTGGYHTFAAIDKERRSGVVVLGNSAVGVIDALGGCLMQLLAGESPPPPTVRLAAKVDPAVFDAYCGEFLMLPGFSITVTRQGDRLLAQATGQAAFRIFPESETEFFYRVVDARISFKRNEQGTVDKLVLHQNGLDLEAKRAEKANP